MQEWMKDFTPATEQHCRAKWSLGKSNERFRCYFCGPKFTLGDLFRWIYTNDGCNGVPGGNPLICRTCFDENGGVEGSRLAWKAINIALPWWAEWSE